MNYNFGNYYLNVTKLSTVFRGNWESIKKANNTIIKVRFNE